MLELRQLQYFVAVAEDEHMGRAAERLHISQSPLSRQIAQLEDKLGFALFERIQQRLRLTADGRTFLAEARSLLTHAQRVEGVARRLAGGKEGALSIGYVDNAVHSGVLSDTLRALKEERPAVTVSLHYKHSQDLLESLRMRSLDVALVCEPPAPDDPELDTLELLCDPVLLAVPADHPLAALPHVSPSDLNNREWICVVNQVHTGKHENLIANCVRDGFVPNFTLEAAEPLAALGLVAAGLGITMVQQSLGRQAPRGVVLLALPWFSYRVPLHLAWHRVKLRPLVDVFRQTLEDTRMTSGTSRKTA